MHHHTDFSQLYQALGVEPGCSIADFRSAYRKCIARLHPDAGGRDEDIACLQQINRMYHLATQFQRVHGRLPGGATTPIVVHPRSSADGQDHDRQGLAQESTARTGTCTAPGHAATVAAPGRRMRLLMLVGVVIALLAWLATRPEGTSWFPPEPLHAPEAAVDVRPGGGAGSSARRMIPGMVQTEVLAISGEPLSRGASRWDYGPSWVAFQCGMVSDWYSSPLRPLHSGPASPDARNLDKVPARCRTTGK